MFWHPDLLWFDPAAGCARCSWCYDRLVPADQPEAVRLHYQGQQLQFHALCFAFLQTEEGLLWGDITAYFAQKRFLAL